MHSDADLLLSMDEHSDDDGGVDEHNENDHEEDDEHDTVTPDEDEDDDNDEGDNFDDDQSFGSNSDAEEPEHEHETPIGLTAVLPQMLFGSVSLSKSYEQQIMRQPQARHEGSDQSSDDEADEEGGDRQMANTDVIDTAVDALFQDPNDFTNQLPRILSSLPHGAVEAAARYLCAQLAAVITDSLFAFSLCGRTRWRHSAPTIAQHRTHWHN